MEKINGCLLNVEVEDFKLLKENPKEFWKGVTIVGAGAFSNLDLFEIEIPEGVTDIERAAFKNCNFLNYVKLPKSLKGIGEFAFENCSRLKSINVPNSVMIISLQKSGKNQLF